MNKNNHTFVFTVNPLPKFRMTQRSKFSAPAKRCMDYQQTVAKIAQALKVPHFGKDLVEFGHIHFYRKGRKCDLDNLLKSFFDGLEYGGVYHNDNQIAAVTSLKIFYVKELHDSKIEFSIFKHLPNEPAKN